TVAPKPAHLVGQAQPDLAGLALPRADSSRPPYLYQPRIIFRQRRYPVEAVAPEIHEPTPALKIGVAGVDHGACPILGMRAGQNDAVTPQQPDALFMELMVGDDVVGEPFRL